MITHPLGILIVLLVVEMGILYLDAHPRTKKIFSFLPSVFWIYFIPMVLATAGIIDPKVKILSEMSKIFLPASLFLLLVSVDIKSILKLGKMSLIMFFMGGIGIMLGAVITYLVFRVWVGNDYWMGFATLAGSWTGGSANMIAVKEAVSVPDNIFLPMVLVDTIVSYVWMGLLVSLVSGQKWFDVWNRSDRTILDELADRIKELDIVKSIKFTFINTLLIIVLGWGMSVLASQAAGHMPEIKDVVSKYTWTILLVSLMGIFGSFTPLKKIEVAGSNKIGYFILYFVLTTIGARADISGMGSSCILILAGVMIAVIHFCVLLATARILKAPFFLVATASQANIGGVASGPIVAEIYQPGLASVGLLLAIMGNICGTYFGIVTAQLCRLFQ